MRDYVRWVSPDAPLYDRMYPNEIHRENQASQTVDDYMRQRLNNGANSDPVGTHSRTGHRDIYPYQPDSSAPKMYYHLGVRPLEGMPEGFAGEKVPLRDQHMEHMQFVANNGENFGILKNSLFSDGAVASDKPSNLGNYQRLREKYNAGLIGEARGQLEKEWVQAERNHLRKESDSGSLQPEAMRKRYRLYLNNCQDYIKQVIDRAATLATPSNPLKLN